MRRCLYHEAEEKEASLGQKSGAVGIWADSEDKGSLPNKRCLAGLKWPETSLFQLTSGEYCDFGEKDEDEISENGHFLQTSTRGKPGVAQQS